MRQGDRSNRYGGRSSCIGGLGGAVAEMLVKNILFDEQVAVNDTFGESGTQSELFEKYGLTVENIVNASKTAIKRKV